MSGDFLVSSDIMEQVQESSSHSQAEENRSSRPLYLNEVWPPGSAEVNHEMRQPTSNPSLSSSSEEKRNWIQRRRNTNVNGSRKATGMTRRCVCNLSQCASTNYMCKSERVILPDGTEEEPGCFIEELSGSPESSGSGPSHGIVTESNGRVTSARRGCIEMLSREKQGLCRKNESKDAGGIECCFQDDMCNYPKTFYPPHNPVSSQSNNQFTNSVSRIPFEPSGGRLNGNGSLDHQVWLRAAVIAVPICGLVILIILIYVAKKLLSGEDDYKEQCGSGGRKGQQGAEFLLPPPLFEAGHCYWCSPVHGPPPPPSTAYLLPQESPGGESSIPDTVWNHVQSDTPTQQHTLPESQSQSPWQQKFFNWRLKSKEQRRDERLRPCHQV